MKKQAAKISNNSPEISKLHRISAATELPLWLPTLQPGVPEQRRPAPPVNTTTISSKVWDKATESCTPSQQKNLPPVPWLGGRKPTLKNENLCSAGDVLITDGALIARSRDFLFCFCFRAVQI